MEIRQIPLSLVTPSPMNPRKTFDEEELQELANNIEKQGLLQPITVRPVKDKKQFAVIDGNADFYPEYEVVCGERRFRAFRKLSDKWGGTDVMDANGEPDNRFSAISAIVREMSDDEAFDAMITENLQRKDVDPIEEAFAFDQLIQKGRTAEEVAARFGKSVRFVQDRVKLNNLIPELLLAVRDEKMSLVAAMLIAKLGDEDQRRFYSQYKNNYHGYSKTSAENFVRELFMTLDESLWYKSDDQADEEFEGGCGRKCSMCANNTANHGCLFWEMKSQDAGRCTSRPDFQAKTLAFLLKEADRISDSLVKEGEPLEFGKTVLCIQDEHVSDNVEVKNIVAGIRAMMAQRGYQIVNPYACFQSRCFYKLEDERAQDLLKNGKVYRCLNIFNWRTPQIQPEIWYLKKDDSSTNADRDGVPYQVREILNSLKGEEDSLKYSYATAGAEALNECSPSGDPLTEKERVMLLTCMLNNNYSLGGRLGMVVSQSTDPDAVHEYVTGHPEIWAAIMRAWMFQQINGLHANLSVAMPMLDEFGNKNCPESYQKKRDNVLSKFNKSKAKAEKKLKELGYGLDGKPLVVTKKVTTPNPDGKTIKKQFKAMKAKHPDAILIFRIGDYYQIFNEDAEIAAPILGLSQAPWCIDLTLNQCGFIHSALDTYLPKLIRAGKRIALCEQLEEPKNKSQKGE